MNVLSVGSCLFELVIWADCFVLLESDFLGKMVGAEVVIEVVVKGFVGEAVDVVGADFFVFLRHCCLEKMMRARVVIEVVGGGPPIPSPIHVQKLRDLSVGWRKKKRWSRCLRHLLTNG